MLVRATLDQTRQIAQRCRNGNETSEAENAKSILAVRPLSFGVREPEFTGRLKIQHGAADGIQGTRSRRQIRSASHGLFPQRRGQVRDGWVARLHNRVRHPCGLSAWRKLESISCASSRYGGCFFCTWLLHRYWTFPTGRVTSPLPQSLLYGTFQVISLSVNYGIFSALVPAGGVWRTYPVLAAAVGSLSPAVISYVLSKWVAFAKPRKLAKLPEGR